MNIKVPKFEMTVLCLAALVAVSMFRVWWLIALGGIGMMAIYPTETKEAFKRWWAVIQKLIDQARGKVKASEKPVESSNSPTTEYPPTTWSSSPDAVIKSSSSQETPEGV